jgi:hypothetical protein
MAGLEHLAGGVAAGRFHAGVSSRRAIDAWPSGWPGGMAGFSVLSFLPDADMIAFPLAIPYAVPSATAARATRS